jgi:hypothetical protein
MLNVTAMVKREVAPEPRVSSGFVLPADFRTQLMQCFAIGVDP